MPVAAEAGLWGLLAGGALVLGAAAAWLFAIAQRLTAAVLAFGAGVLISALSFDLMEEAYSIGGFDSTSIGFLAGAIVYTAANIGLARAGARHRKRSGSEPDERLKAGEAGVAIAVGSLLDGVPESIVIGVSMVEGGAVSLVAVVAIFLSNVPEGLSGTAGMKTAGRSALYVFGLWIGIALASGLASFLGYAVFAGLSPKIVAAAEAVAAGAMLAMIADTMMPEAFEEAHDFAGLITVAGFLCAFVLSRLAGG